MLRIQRGVLEQFCGASPQEQPANPFYLESIAPSASQALMASNLSGLKAFPIS
jgi:hypothetical protein